MVALILAAGYGTRLYPLTEKIPKALLPVGEKPILAHILERLTDTQVLPEELIVVSNHPYAEAFKKWFDASGFSIPWKILDDGSTSEENRLGSVGDLGFALRQMSGPEDTLVIGSDNLFEDSLDRFVLFARGKSPAATLAVYALADQPLASRYGVLTLDHQDLVVEFKEKPPKPTSPLVSTAIYFFPRSVLGRVLEYVDSTPAGRHDTLGSFIQWLITREKVYAYRLKGRWFDIGDLHSYENAKENFSV